MFPRPSKAKTSGMPDADDYARTAFQLRGVSSPMHESLWAPARAITSVR